MKKNIKCAAICGLVLLLCFNSACNKGFDEVNKNPNSAEEVPADLLLPNGIKTSMNLYWGNGAESLGGDVGNLFPQHFARIQYTEPDRYTVPQGVIDNSWRDFYAGGLNDFQEVEKIGTTSGNPNYIAVAKILKSWVFSLLTDIYGDIPYKDALKGNDKMLSPTYDSQKNVYAGIINELKVANDMIVVDKSPIKGDILLSNKMLQWKKFANSLSLRLLNRMLGKTDAPINVTTEINRILSDPAKYPVIASNTDNIQLNYLSVQPNTNPIYVNRLTRDDHRVSATVVNKLKALSDERLKVYAERPDNGDDYKGVPNGLLAGDAAALGLAKTSKAGKYFTVATAPAVIMTYAELLFIKAELAYKGITAYGTAQQNYLLGITASHNQYNLTPAPAYLQSVEYLGGTTGYTQIMEQKWIALFGQGIEAWTEQRRTGIPVLQVPTINTNDNILPTRLPYPLSEESLNNANFKAALAAQGGSNNMKFKLWWAK